MNKEERRGAILHAAQEALAANGVTLDDFVATEVVMIVSGIQARSGRPVIVDLTTADDEPWTIMGMVEASRQYAKVRLMASSRSIDPEQGPPKEEP